MEFFTSLNWPAVLSGAGFYALVVGAASWVAKSLAEQYLKRRFHTFEKALETQAAELKARFDAQLETTKAELSLALLKNSKLHEKRMAVLETLYQKIVVLHDAMRELTAEVQFILADPAEEERTRLRTATSAYEAFQQYYAAHKIFFSLASCAQIDTLHSTYFNGLLRYRSHPVATDAGPLFSAEQTLTASDTIRRAVPPVLRLIEQDFRALLGVQ